MPDHMLICVVIGAAVEKALKLMKGAVDKANLE